jgi:predicted NUDIX family NTP pyrophosphohydrolase
MSAGLLPYRLGTGLEVLIAHPGGPLWAAKDAGHWSVIKGELVAGEDPQVAAAREFEEETGWAPLTNGWIELGSVKLKSGKTVFAWGFESDYEQATFNPGTFTMVWRGRSQEFPEIDQVSWCEPVEAIRLLNPAQVPFIERLLLRLAK